MSDTFPTDSTQNENLHISLRVKLVALSQSLEYFQQKARTVGLFNRVLWPLSIRMPDVEGEPGVTAQQDPTWGKKKKENLQEVLGIAVTVPTVICLGKLTMIHGAICRVLYLLIIYYRTYDAHLLF